jgi:hypothetical protein
LALAQWPLESGLFTDAMSSCKENRARGILLCARGSQKKVCVAPT